MNLPAAPSSACTTPALLASSEESRWFAEEVQPHEPKLRAWLQARFPTLTETDDLVQESYARLLRAKAAGEIRNPKGYVFTTAFNAALDLLRRNNVVPFEPAGDFSALAAITEDRTDIADHISRSEEIALLHEAMNTLPARCREIFSLRKVSGLSHKQIAEKLGISPKTIEEQISRATRRCAAFLRSRGLP